MTKQSLSEKARLLTETIRKQNNIKNRASSQQELERLTIKIGQKKNAIFTFSDKCMSARDVVDLSFDFEKCIEVGKDVNEIILQNKEKFDIDSIFSVSDELDVTIKILRDAVEKSWKRIIDNTVKNRNGLLDLIDSFSQVPGADQAASKIGGYLEEISDLEISGLNSSNLKKLKEISGKIQNLLKDLFGSDVSVQKFAHSIAEGGASIDHLTPPVLEWLKEKGFVSSFKIVPGLAHSEDNE